jgi:hypothetical protein
MVEVFQGLSNVLIEAYNALIAAVPPVVQQFILFFGIAIFIVVSALLIYVFYQSISKKNLFGLNLNKYNKTKHPFITKLLAGSFYIIEYILLLPFIIFLWFIVFTFFLILLASEGVEISTLLILAATTIAAIRMISYHNEDLARDVAKLIPLTLLATSLLNPNFFSISRILGQIKTIPGVFHHILTYLLFIIILEMVMRILDFLFALFQLDSGKDNEASAEEEEAVKKELSKPAKRKH